MKTATMHIRLNEEHKRLVEQAAVLCGLSISDYVGAAILVNALAVLQKEQELLLSEYEFSDFEELVCNPPSPNTVLRTALEEFRKGTTLGERYECDL